MSRAWMPMYWGDYLKNTRELTTLEHGAYLLLIAHYWEHGGLPDDESFLKNIAGVSQYTWKNIRKTLAGKFEDGWRHKRIDRELLKMEKGLMQRVLAGQKGGTASGMARAIVRREIEKETKRLLERPSNGSLLLAQAETKQPETNHISKKEEESLSIRPRSVVDIVEEARRRRKGLWP